MNSPDFDNYPEGEWENHEDVVWNEFDWQKYLNKNEQEIAKFLGFYNKLKNNPYRLDEIAKRMGWTQEDWRAQDLLDNDPESEEANEWPATPPQPQDPNYEAYTVHKHPVYIITHGLYQHIYQCWQQFTLDYQWALSPFFVSQFSKNLHVGEFNAIMAINALDVADFNLTVAHLKNALSSANHSLKLAQRIPPKKAQIFDAFYRELSLAIFDMREIWLRVMKDCRDEHKRHDNEKE